MYLPDFLCDFVAYNQIAPDTISVLKESAAIDYLKNLSVCDESMKFGKKHLWVLFYQKSTLAT